MKLSIVGCPDKERFRPYVKRAAIFFAEQLITKKMLENIYLRIKFDSKLEVYGYASVEEYNDSGKPREFCIEINPNIGAHDILETLAHEMVHVKQLIYHETNDELSVWKGKRVNSELVDYWHHPWEIDAHGREDGLLTKFAVHECLWEIFEGFKDPSLPILSKPIRWKKLR